MIPLLSEYAHDAICRFWCCLGFFGDEKSVQPEKICGFACGRGHDPALVIANDGDDSEVQRAAVIAVHCVTLAVVNQDRVILLFDLL